MYVLVRTKRTPFSDVYIVHKRYQVYYTSTRTAVVMDMRSVDHEGSGTAKSPNVRRKTENPKEKNEKGAKGADATSNCP